MNNFYVYVILNLDDPNILKFGDFEFKYTPIYVGKGKGKRNLEHFKPYSLKQNSHKNKTLLKYNCDTLILMSNLSEDDAFSEEKRLIELIGRKNIKTGSLLNLTSGGQGVSGYIYSEEQLEKRSKNNIGDKNNFYGKKHKPDSFKKFKRPVNQIDKITGKVINTFDSLSIAAKETSSDENHIRDCCNGNRKTHNGFRWSDDSSDYINTRTTNTKKSNKKRKISKLNLKNEFLEEFDSISEASRISGISKSNIIGCLKHRKRTAGGFIWIYNEDIDKHLNLINE